MGLITPFDTSGLQWPFGYVEIRRLQTEQRLQRDFEINIPGAALALNLLEELEAKRRRSRDHLEYV